MNLRHVGYRAYQCVFGLGARLLPWRQPETITGPGSLADIPARLTRYGARRPLVVRPGKAPERLARLAELVGLSDDSEADRANAFIDAIFAMNARLGIPTGFTCIREADLPQMAAWAAKEANPTYPVPVIYDRARFIRVIRQVMQ